MKTVTLEEIADYVTRPETPSIIEVDLELLMQPDLRRVLSEAGYFVAWVKEKPPQSAQELFQTLYDLCQFPAYFGFNWNALKDSLLDFSEQPARGYFILYPVPTALPAADLQLFFEIVQMVGRIWQVDDIPFKLLVPYGTLARV